MMSRFVRRTLSAVLLLAVFTTAPAAAQDDRRTYDLAGFTEVNLSVQGELYLRQGDTFRVEIEGRTEVLDVLDVSVRGDELEIEYENGRENGNWWERLFGNDFDDEDKVDVYVTLPELTGLSVNGAGKVTAETDFTIDDLDIQISGAGNVEMMGVNGTSIEANMSGAGNLEVEGDVDRLDIEISGAGNVEAEDLKTASTRVRISGAGSCEVYATDELDVQVSGVGSVKYRGNPTVRERVSGMGSVSKM